MAQVRPAEARLGGRQRRRLRDTRLQRRGGRGHHLRHRNAGARRPAHSYRAGAKQRQQTRSRQQQRAKEERQGRERKCHASECRETPRGARLGRATNAQPGRGRGNSRWTTGTSCDTSGGGLGLACSSRRGMQEHPGLNTCRRCSRRSGSRRSRASGSRPTSCACRSSNWRAGRHGSRHLRRATSSRWTMLAIGSAPSACATTTRTTARRRGSRNAGPGSCFDEAENEFDDKGAQGERDRSTGVPKWAGVWVCPGGAQADLRTRRTLGGARDWRRVCALRAPRESATCAKPPVYSSVHG